MMQDTIIQLVLAICGLTALYLSTGNNPRGRRWGPVIGLCGQPAWLLFAWQANAWGLFSLSLVYSMVYVRGIRLQWSAKA